jgi:hypothetical protein
LKNAHAPAARDWQGKEMMSAMVLALLWVDWLCAADRVRRRIFTKGFNELFVNGTSLWRANVRVLAEVDKPAKGPDKVGMAVKLGEGPVI